MTQPIQEYLGDGVYVEYLNDIDQVMISTLREITRHYVYFTRTEYEALKRFAQEIGWEESKEKK